MCLIVAGLLFSCMYLAGRIWSPRFPGMARSSLDTIWGPEDDPWVPYDSIRSHLRNVQAVLFLAVHWCTDKCPLSAGQPSCVWSRSTATCNLSHTLKWTDPFPIFLLLWNGALILERYDRKVSLSSTRDYDTSHFCICVTTIWWNEWHLVISLETRFSLKFIYD